MRCRAKRARDHHDFPLDYFFGLPLPGLRNVPGRYRANRCSNIGFLDDLGPAHDLRLEEFGELFGRARNRLESGVLHLFHGVGHRRDLDPFRVQPVDDVARGPCGRKDPVPGGHLTVVYAGLLCRRHVGQRRHALVAEHRERSHLAGLNLRQRRRGGRSPACRLRRPSARSAPDPRPCTARARC